MRGGSRRVMAQGRKLSEDQDGLKTTSGREQSISDSGSMGESDSIVEHWCLGETGLIGFRRATKLG